MEKLHTINRNEEILKTLFHTAFQEEPAEITRLAGGGSDRQYYRLRNKKRTSIGVVGEDIRENETFLALDSMLEKEGVCVPHVFAVSDDSKFYLLQDVGDICLLSLFDTDLGLDYAKKALDDLVEIQLIPEEKWERLVSNCPFSGRLVKWDLNYFKYDFLKVAGIDFHEERLEDDFEKLTHQLTASDMLKGLMYRDFQSRNIFFDEGKLWYIDFQGARLGPVVYDAVSLIWQAKAPFDFSERGQLQEYYSMKMSEKTGIPFLEISHQFDKMIVFRTLQVLGAYGFRGLIEKKAHFIESVPKVVANLTYLRQNGYLDELEEIKRVSEHIERWEEERRNKTLKEDGLTVRVGSFSYKKGYPEDVSGNGGGFMFDCRALHNPGRFEEYKNLTGLDNKVKDFLKATPEAEEFIKNCLDVVKPSVERYLSRGFTSLQVGFGCTGGQHRSVYCAEEFSKALKEIFPDIRIIVQHREQDVTKAL